MRDTGYLSSFCAFSLKFSVLCSEKVADFVQATLAKHYFEKTSLKLFKIRIMFVFSMSKLTVGINFLSFVQKHIFKILATSVDIFGECSQKILKESCKQNK